MKYASVGVGLSLILLSPKGFSQGPLTPPGAPAPTMKTLDQVEARTPISTTGMVITASGSYYLAANLTPSGNNHGVTVSAKDVTLDLNGFVIDGSGAASFGVYIESTADNCRVYNGTIRDCLGSAVYAESANCTIRDVRANGNSRGSTTYSAVYLGGAGHVEGCLIEGNDGGGVEAANGSAIVGNTVLNNGASGLKVTGTGNRIADNTVKGNADNYDFAAGNQLNLLLGEIPETLDWPCSVKLAGTLTCVLTGVDGIAVNSDNVTIDLGNYALIGPGASSGSGIKQDSAYSNLTIFNGRVEHWNGSFGLELNGGNGNLTCIEASTNHYGISVMTKWSLRVCVARANTLNGIYAAFCNTLQDCAANDNGIRGLYADSGNTLHNCTAYDNSTSGFDSNGNTFQNCSACRNGTEGIYLSGVRS